MKWVPMAEKTPPVNCVVFVYGLYMFEGSYGVARWQRNIDEYWEDVDESTRVRRRNEYMTFDFEGPVWMSVVTHWAMPEPPTSAQQRPASARSDPETGE